jgi:hypothetical protein
MDTRAGGRKKGFFSEICSPRKWNPTLVLSPHLAHIQPAASKKIAHATRTSARRHRLPRQRSPPPPIGTLTTPAPTGHANPYCAAEKAAVVGCPPRRGSWIRQLQLHLQGGGHGSDLLDPAGFRVWTRSTTSPTARPLGWFGQLLFHFSRSPFYIPLSTVFLIAIWFLDMCSCVVLKGRWLGGWGSLQQRRQA